MCNFIARRRPWIVKPATALAFAVLILSPSAAYCQTTNWTGAAGAGGSGNYNVLGNWDNGIPNGAGFDAVVSTLNGGNPYTITLNSAATVNSLTISSSQAIFDHTSATYVATTVNISAGIYRLHGGTLQGATVNVSGTGVFQATTTSSTLSGVSVVGGLDMSASSALLVLQANGATPTTFASGTALTLGTNAGLRINQTGVLDNMTFTLGNGSVLSAEGSNTVTFGPAATVTLATTNSSASLAQPQAIGGTSNFANQGLIQSTAANATLTISPNGTFTNGTASPNSGTVRASGGGIVTLQTSTFTNQAGGLVDVQSGSTININGPGWSNLGTFQVTSGTLNLGGSFTTAAIGTITRSGTSVVKLTGSVNNTGASNLLALTGPLLLSSGTITGGNLTASGGVLQATSSAGTLSGVTVGLGVVDLSASGVLLNLQANGATPTTFASGTALTLGTNAGLRINQTGVLDNIAFTLGNGSVLSAEGSNTVTFGPAATVTLSTASTSASLAQPQIIGGTSNFANQGLIQSTAANATLTISPNGTFTNGTASPNSGTVRASGGGIVTLQTSTFTNQAGGLVDVQSGSTVNVNNSGWSNLGTFQVTSGTLNLGGSFTTTAIGTITRSGTSVVKLTGSVNNTGASNLLALTGPLLLSSGTITGGNLTPSGASVLQVTSTSGTLSGVTVGLGAVDMSGASALLVLQANGGTPTTFASGTALTLGTNAGLRINQTGVLDNIAFTLGNGSVISAEASNTVTFGPAATITLGTASTSATLAQPQIIGGTSNFANQGLIQSTAANATLTISPNGTFTNGTASPNSGTVRASGGGIVTLQTSTFTNQAGGLVDVQSGSTVNVNNSGWSNLGTFQVTSGTLNLGGSFTTTAIGTITRSGTSVVKLTGSVNNTGASNLLALTGPLLLSSGTITGGNLTASGGVLQATSSAGTLSGVTVVSGLDMSASGVLLNLQANGATPTTFASGTALTLGTNAGLRINQTGVLDNIAFTLGNGSVISAEASNTVTFGPAATITLGTASTSATLAQPQIIGGTSNFANQGLIQSTAANATLTISPNGTFTNGTASPNSGIVRASGGGIVTLQTSTFTNQAGGLVDVQSGSTININGPGWSNLGTFQVTSGTLNLGGSFTTAAIGTITRSGTSVVKLTGSVNNTGASNLLALTGPLLLSSGTITGGNLTPSGASVLQVTSTSGTLSGVTVVSGLDISASSALLVLQANAGTPTTFASGTALTLGTNAGLRINQTGVLDNIAFTLGNGSVISAEGSNTVTFGPAATITLGTASTSATLAQPQIIGGTSSFVNQGLIQSTASNATLTISPNGALTNSGTISASNGGIVAIPAATNFSNFNAGTLTGGTYQVFASSVMNFNGRVITTVSPNTTVLLDGASSVFTAANTITTNNGSFTISNGKQHTAASFTNSGTLVVGTAPNDLATLTGSVQVNSGGVVKGTGTIAGSVNLASGSTLAPGTSPGILTVTGAMTMTSGANYSIELNGNTPGTGHTQLNLTGGGSINLNNATLTSTLGYFPASTDVFTIISGGPVTGTFNGLPNNSPFVIGTFQGTQFKANIVYTANSVLLTQPVPEPIHLLLVCGGFSAAVGLIRRRAVRIQA